LRCLFVAAALAVVVSVVAAVPAGAAKGGKSDNRARYGTGICRQTVAELTGRFSRLCPHSPLPRVLDRLSDGSLGAAEPPQETFGISAYPGVWSQWSCDRRVWVLW
jgi:hypothetical protein